MRTASWTLPVMDERIVINTGPLISLARAELLDVVGRLPYRFLCPKEVSEEIAVGIMKGYPLAEPKWLTTLTLSSPMNPIAEASLDKGEAAVIQLAIEQKIPSVCVDERKGRRAAQAVGLQVTGTLGLLGRAKSAQRYGVLSASITKNHTD
jgi:predicted nucleic acid-binding protein